MDRHIQQTNDRLQCIKQVCIKTRPAAFQSSFNIFYYYADMEPAQTDKSEFPLHVPSFLRLLGAPYMGISFSGH